MDTDRTVLLLHGDTLYWFRVKDNCVLDVNVRSVAEARRKGTAMPVWITPKDHNQPYQIELVLDTSLDEVDRAGVLQSTNRIINLYRRIATLFRLRRDYPLARIYPLPGLYEDLVCGLMHAHIAEEWSDVLELLQASGVMICKVSTASELIVDWSSQFDTPMLVVTRVAGFERHLLVDSGAAVFLRTVSSQARVSSSGQFTETLSQTLDHIKVHLSSICDDVAIVEPGIDYQADEYPQSAHPELQNSHLEQDAARSLSNSSEGTQPRGLLPESVHCLIHMLLYIPVKCKLTDSSIDDVNPVGGSSIITRARQESDTGIRKMLQRYKSISRKYQLFDREPMRGSKDLLQSCAASLPVLGPSVNFMKARQRTIYALRCSILLAILSSITVITAFTSGISVAKVSYRLEKEREEIYETGQGRLATARALHQFPEMAAISLSLTDQLIAPPIAGPSELLESLALAITGTNEVQLNRVVWTPVETDEDYATLAYALESVPARRSVDVAEAFDELQIELTGVVTGSTIKDQKHRLDQFTAALQELPGVRAVKIMESPLDTALTSDSNVSDTGVFRLLLRRGVL